MTRVLAGGKTEKLNGVFTELWTGVLTVVLTVVFDWIIDSEVLNNVLTGKYCLEC